MSTEEEIAARDGLDAEFVSACCSGDCEKVKSLLQDVDINKQHEDTWSALMYASSKGHMEVAKLLLKSGAQVDIQTERGESALIVASMNGHHEMVTLLLSHGAQVNMQDVEGWSALMHASLDGHVKVAKLLLDHGTEVNMHNYGKDLPPDSDPDPYLEHVVCSYTLVVLYNCKLLFPTEIP